MTDNTAVAAVSASSALATLGTTGTLGFLMGKPGEGPQVPAPFSKKICLTENMLVAGTTHAPNIEESVADLQAGARLRFMRAPSNPYDQWAIEVYDPQDRRVGFLPADSNEMIARMMDAGKLIYGEFTYASKRGSWNRVHMEVYLDD